MPEVNKKILILASGAGSTFDHLCQVNSDSWRVASLIVSRNCGAFDKALHRNIPAAIVSPKNFDDFGSWDYALTAKAIEYNPDFILLAGFLKKIGPHFLKAFKGKVFNTHPSLLPSYGGKGMYGRRVHEQVIADRAKETGVSLHWVNEEYDEGDLIDQVQLSLAENETVESLESQLKALEKDFLVKNLNRLCSTN